MTLNPVVLRDAYKTAVGRDAQGRENEGGRHRFVTTVRNWLGLCDRDGNRYRDRNGNMMVNLQESSGTRFAAEDFNMQELAHSLLGTETFYTYMNPDNRGSLRALPAYNGMLALQNPGDPVALLENVGAGIDPSAFADINAWTSINSGLLERRILEQFTQPNYIGDELLQTESTRVNEGQKIIGTSRALPVTAGSSFAAVERLPNQPHARTTILERYVTLGRGREYGLGIDVTKEAAFFDLTGQLLPSAGNLGWLLGLEKELQQIDAFIGVTTQSGGLFQFVYKGTAQNTYTATPITPAGAQYSLGYTSQIASNGPLLDYTNLQTSWTTYLRNTDPETGTRINDLPDTVLVNPANLAAANLTINPPGVERREAQGLTQASTSQLLITEGSNPAKMFGASRVLWSPLVEQRCTDASGLNLSQTTANGTWWHFTRGKPFKWMQIMPMQVQTASPQNYDSIDRGLLLSVFCDWRAFSASVSPWHVIRNTP
jgi:hypothetical protein